MKTRKQILIGIIAIFMIGCFSSENTEETFKINDPATGQIYGQNWTVKCGIGLNIDLFGEKYFTIHLIDTIVDNLCDRNYRKIRRVSVDMNRLEVGKFTVEQLKKQDEFHAIYFFDPEVNKKLLDEGDDATEGYVEIIKIDKDKKNIEGYIDAVFDEKNKVKGNFIIEQCPDI